MEESIIDNTVSISFKKGDGYLPLGGPILWCYGAIFRLNYCSFPDTHPHPQEYISIPRRDFFSSLHTRAPLGLPISLPAPFFLLPGLPRFSFLFLPLLSDSDSLWTFLAEYFFSFYSYYEEATHLSTNMEIFQRKRKWQE